MKNSSIKKNYQNFHSAAEKKILDNVHGNINISPKAVKPIMTEELVVPPARVWNKIEKILDQQEERRNYANHLIAASFNRVASNARRKKIYLAAGVSLLAGIAWFIR